MLKYLNVSGLNYLVGRGREGGREREGRWEGGREGGRERGREGGRVGSVCVVGKM